MWPGYFVLEKKGTPLWLVNTDSQMHNTLRTTGKGWSSSIANAMLAMYMRKHREILRRFSGMAGSSDKNSEFSATIRGISFPTS